MTILEHYKAIYEELLAVPVIKGYKTEKEKFAGGHRTTTVEAYIAATGRAIQGATSHNLGQNFGKMFKIEYEDQQGKKQIPWQVTCTARSSMHPVRACLPMGIRLTRARAWHVYTRQTSWGFTTRSIGVMVMTHSDDTGLVLPPRVAPIQVVIIPIIMAGMDVAKAKGAANELYAQLKAAGVRATVDDRENYNPGWKYAFADCMLMNVTTARTTTPAGSTALARMSGLHADERPAPRRPRELQPRLEVRPRAAYTACTCPTCTCPTCPCAACPTC